MQHSPAPAVLVASRPVQNAHTGLDLSVPEYQEIRGKMMSGHVEYNIVVVTQLAAFKSAKHKPEDVIQFMVSKKYSEIEEFYQKLVSRYPQASLPSLPRKVLFVGESDIRERRVMFNEIMRSISKEADLAMSPELLEFLGTRSASVVDFKGKNLPDKEEEENEAFDFFREEGASDIIPQFKSSKEQGVKSTKEEEDEEEDDDVDPLGVIKSKKTKKPLLSPVRENQPKLTIFDEELDPDDELFGSAKKFSFTGNKRISSAKENLKLFEDPDLGGMVMLGDSLLLPTACVSREQTVSSTLEEDTSELLRVEEDFEKMWNLSAKPKPKPKPQVPPKPAVPKKPTVDSKVPVCTASKVKSTEVKAQSMGEVDILKYIQENESRGSEEPSLF
ncbi:PREDICTED: HCLS1-binding protein 3 isoform X2 [Gekko japonicus]|uniref:HCLS1-binding protein 3 isoform X2 n=1 Tax=Gekko japonicus TaxID=146911 RepID=A0ABM1JVT7_GEKJA|nr:PREDICTED: HCLS1-binding protein 3 isoform X2 [Gekko japonicus]